MATVKTQGQQAEGREQAHQAAYAGAAASRAQRAASADSGYLGPLYGVQGSIHPNPLLSALGNAERMKRDVERVVDEWELHAGDDGEAPEALRAARDSLDLMPGVFEAVSWAVGGLLADLPADTARAEAGPGQAPADPDPLHRAIINLARAGDDLEQLAESEAAQLGQLDWPRGLDGTAHQLREVMDDLEGRLSRRLVEHANGDHRKPRRVTVDLPRPVSELLRRRAGAGAAAQVALVLPAIEAAMAGDRNPPKELERRKRYVAWLDRHSVGPARAVAAGSRRRAGRPARRSAAVEAVGDVRRRRPGHGDGDGDSRPPRRLRRAGSRRGPRRRWCACGKRARAGRRCSMNGSPKLMLADDYDPDYHNCLGWWTSEKLDGVRALWTGRQFLSRSGNAFNAPRWLRELLPDRPLDGELWAGRGLFRRTVSIVRTARPDERWREIKFRVFDILDGSGSSYRQRHAAIKAIVSELPERGPVSLVEQTPVHDKAEIQSRFEAVLAAGGEGLMLRDPDSLYERRRSRHLLNLKPSRTIDATVVAVESGRGRHAGRMGALRCMTPAGVAFGVGTGFTDEERELRHAAGLVGEVIEVSYERLTDRGRPLGAAFKGARAEQEASLVSAGGAA